MKAIIQINQHRRFSKESDYAAFAAVRVHNSILNELGGRNSWVYIQSVEEGVYRTVRGSGSLIPFPEDAMELDYDTAVELAIQRTERAQTQGQGQPVEDPFYPCDLKVRPVRRLGVLKAHWNHPNPAYRVPLQISMVLGSLSVILGTIGAVLGVLGIFGR